MRALISVSDKSGVVEFARALDARGYQLVSTGGTAGTLAAAGLPVVSVSDVTGFPEMMDGRVKTLHPAIHGGILARRDHADDLRAAEQHGIGLIDLVAVNLYPFAQAAADPSIDVPGLIEQIDIGGPGLLRAAGKNFRHVLVVVDPEDYGRVVEALDAGRVDLGFRLQLAQKAFAHTARYDTTIAATLTEIVVEHDRLERHRQPVGALPDTMVLPLSKLRDLRYGENPHQLGAWYRTQGTRDALPIEILQGKELSFTNLLDLDAAYRIMCEFEEPAGVVIKHTNPCGAAVAATSAEAYVRARDADALSAFGGIVGLNRRIDAAAADALVSTFIEAVIAPGVDDGARAILAGKKNLRVVVTRFPEWPRRTAGGGVDVRSIFGATWLVEQRDSVEEAWQEWPLAPSETFRVVTRRQPTEEEWKALRFAWRICTHVKSNSVIFTSGDRTLAVGAGQMSRVDAVRSAVLKASRPAVGDNTASGKPLAGSVSASDAFFPFRDGLDEVAAAGATAVIQPGGSVRDAEVVAAADEHGMAMVFTGRRHFRH
ncbi:MAG: bifunctional phosphoribosylaminoimidazolecarboxamide formyltransferase/IMP cyclohydrolase [Bacteroidales bacterium]